MRPSKGRASVPDQKRIFKSKWFAKAAAKQGISDSALCKAMIEIISGQADDLGGGVWKKRLNNNRDRAIVLAKGKKSWIFVFLYMKKDRENIDDVELAAFRKLASHYAGMTEEGIATALSLNEIVEICHETK